MRKDAVVLEIRKKTAVVLASDGRFLRVRNQGYRVGQRIAEAEQTPVRLRPMLRRTLLIAACLVLALGSSALAASKYMVWSYAGVDVGDISVNYTLNFRNEVLSAEGNSEEAEQLIESLEKIPYEPVDSAVERMVDAAGENQHEESEGTEIVISVASFIGGTGRTEDRIMEGVDRSMEKARPDEPKEKRQEDVRIERIEWQDAGQFMDDRHHPQSTPNPEDMGEEPQQQLEGTKPETTEKQPEDQPTDAPRNTEAAPVRTDEQPAQNPIANPEKPGNQEQEPKTSGQDQQEPRNSPSDAENPVNEPTGTETIPEQENPAPENPDNDQTQPVPQDSPGQQRTETIPENDMHGQSKPGNIQEPQKSGEHDQPQPVQPQSPQPQQAPDSDHAGTNPGGQNIPDSGGKPSDQR